MDHAIVDWGITWAEIEPYYARTDKLIGTSGKAGNLRGKTVEGGNPFEGPRGEEYPPPPMKVSYFSSLFRDAAKSLGFHPHPNPSAILSTSYTNPDGIARPGCFYCGFCDRFGCMVSAKSQPTNTLLPILAKQKTAILRNNCSVRKIVHEGNQARGVYYVDESGEECFQPADAVLLCSWTSEGTWNLHLGNQPINEDGTIVESIIMLAAGVAMLLPKVANAVTVAESDVTVKTPDGTADCYFVHPSTGTAPGVLVWPDIFGLRPAFRQMGKRLAESGYSVLVVNPFYRTQKAPTAAQGAATPIQQLLPLARSLNATTQVTDAKAFVGWLDQQSSVAKNRKVGTQGYCMGGAMAFRTAYAAPDRVGAVASFHGGNGLVTDMPDSPHLQAAMTQAQFLVAKKTFAMAGLPAEVEV